jgi:hypothetical protein
LGLEAEGMQGTEEEEEEDDDDDDDEAMVDGLKMVL